MDEDDELTDRSASDLPEDPPTERVRIIGAQTAGEATSGEVPAQPRPGTLEERYLGFGQGDENEDSPPPAAVSKSEDAGEAGTLWGGRLDDEFQDQLAEAPSGGGNWFDPEPAHNGGEALAVSPQLPDWTDPPTGQVPAILDRRGEDAEEGSWAQPGDSGPSWREHDHEWEDTSFEPALLADEDTRMGALEDTPLEERRPWEFRDLSPVGSSPGGDDEGTATGSWWDDEDLPDDLARDEPIFSDAPVAADLGLDPSGQEAAFRTAPVEAVPARETVTAISSSPLRHSEPTSILPLGPARGGRGLRPRGPRPEPPAGSGGGRNLRLAIATGVGVAAVTLLCLWAGAPWALVLATVVVTLAAAEYYAAVRRAGHHPATLVGLVATVAVMVVAYTKGVPGLPLVLALLVVTALVWYLVGEEPGSAIDGVSVTVFGFAWIGLLGAFAALMLAPSQYPHRHGVAFLFGAIVAVVGEDVGALAIGGWLGRHHMAPRVSPNKTWEGFAGGAVLAVVLSVALTGQMHPWTPAKAAVLGVVVAVLAPIGDLCESLVKRDLHLKDMGSLLPGHGGILDRVDALLFVLPATYYLVRVLHLG